MLKSTLSLIFFIVFSSINSQTWQDVGGGLNSSTHGLLEWNGQLVVLGSFNNNPCDRVALWDGTNYSCLLGGVGIVARAAVVWDGKLVVVGDFWNNFQPCVGCNGVAVWDGVSWSPLGNGVNNDVLTCTVWNNELVIGGDFTESNGVPIARIAKWNGSIWESVGPIGVFSNDIRCMTEFENELWVGGDFNNVGGCSSCDGLVKYDPSTGGWVGGNSGVDLVGGVDESVRVLYVNPTDENLYMGGEFPELIDGDVGVADFNMSGIAMYDGSNWTPLGTGLNEYCRAIHEYNGKVVAGGYFTTAGGVPANKIAAWDGTNWSAMGLGFDANGIDEYVKAATEWNGIFFAGGAFTQAEGGPMDFISQWYEAPTAPPTAWMTSSSSTLCGSGCIDFLDNSTNAPTSWNWTFPGSNTPTSSVANPGAVCWSSPGTYNVSLQACNAFGCNTQNLDIEVTNGVIVTVNSETICLGNSTTLTANPSVSGGNFLWSPGGQTTQSITVSPSSNTTYSVVYSMPGCTSGSVVSTVDVVTGYNTNETIEACQNSSVIYPDGTIVTITSSTSHTSLLTSVNGCDSTVLTNVNMVTAYSTTENISTCQNTTIVYPDGTQEMIIANTSHTSMLLSITGCDSIVLTNVNMNPNYNIVENIFACNGTVITYPDGFDQVITGNTSHTSNLSSINGCDSIVVTNVTMQSTYNATENTSVCPGTLVTFPDGTSQPIFNDLSHTNNLTSIYGCDSIIVSNVSVQPTYSLSENTTICTGSDYTYPDGTISTNVVSSESHTSLLTSINGCDSTIITNVSVTNGFNTSENVSLCSGDDYVYPDGTNSTNILVDEFHISNLFSVFGCDSLVTTSISVTALPDVSVASLNNVLTANQSGALYQWLNCNNGNSPIAGETNQVYTPLNNGSYAVSIELNGCTDISNCEVISTIGLIDLSYSNSIVLYPNPAFDQIELLTSDNIEFIDYKIVDAIGRTVMNGDYCVGDKIDIGRLSPGTYTIELGNGIMGNYPFIKR